MTDPTPAAASQKYLSFSAILVLAANTMNGPGITTLPDVAADAGLTLYVTLIALSVTMAAFVCRRMVYAMWASVEEDTAVADGEEDYSSMKKVESGLMVQSLSMDEGSEAGRPAEVRQVDEIIPGPTDKKDLEAHLTHREHDHEHQAPKAIVQPRDEPHTEGESLLTHKDHDENMAVIAGRDTNRPVLERTSIVGQSREAYGTQASVYTAFTMVASALCLGLAQMMLCAAILDGMFVAIAGKSCALGLPTPTPDDVESASFVYCTSHSSMKPYMGSGAPMSLISIGWVISATASVAMGSVDLDEMMGVQYFLFGCLVVSAVRFSAVLKGMSDGFDATTNDGGDGVDVGANGGSAVDWFVGPHPFQTVGPIMFNFAFVVTSPPSSAYARKEKIAYKALGMSCVVMGTLYTMVGLTGSSVSNAVRNGMVKGGDDSNLLSLILLSGGDDGPSILDLGIIGLFGFSTVASVPVYCLLAKETLIYDAGVAPFPSFILSNVVPWILVAITYNAAFFEAFVNWSGLLILGYSNFSIPLLLDLKLKKVRAFRAMSKSGSKQTRGDDGRTTAITKTVFVVVTASITLVIVMSITNSLTMALTAFCLMVGLMTQVKV